MVLYAQTVQQAADVAAREISRTPLRPRQLMDVLYSNVPSDYSSSGGSSTVRTALFDPQLLQFDMTTGVPAGQSVLDVVQTWPIINQMLYPAMIVQPGDQVYGGTPTDQYLCYPGAVPCTDSANPNRTVYCVARIDSRTPDGAETITWVPVIEEMTSRRSPVAVFRGIAAGRTVSLADQLRLPIGHDERLSPAADLAAGADRPAVGSPHDSGGDGQFLKLHSDRHGAPSAVGTYSGPYGLGTQEAWANWQRKESRTAAATASATARGRAALSEPDFGPGDLSPRSVPIAS